MASIVDRSFFQIWILASLCSWVVARAQSGGNATLSGEVEIDVYFGAGCFWHVQSVINKIEKDLFGRAGAQLTGITGYAGGTQNGGSICYTNYGGLGHTEVVVARVPRRMLGRYAAEVWPRLFPGGERSDGVNLGAAYRAAVGFPGGAQGAPDVLQVIDAAQPPGASRAVLEPGVGDDGDSWGFRKVYVYDSNAFPFHQAELYHQFHDDFSGSALERQRQELMDVGRLAALDCPSDFMASLNHPAVIALLSVLGAICLGCVVYKAVQYHCWNKRVDEVVGGP